MSSHYKGLALDWLTGMKVVLANGTLVAASDTENTDLYWAMRGAGSSFGIAVEYTFKTFEPPAVLTPFMTRLNWNNETSAKAGFKILQDWVADEMAAEITARLFINKGGASLEGLFYGNKTELNAAIDPLLKSLNSRLMFSQEGGWLDQLTYFGMGVSLDQTHPYVKVSYLDPRGPRSICRARRR
jgi:FAD/FMN-containing dehydrogenase